MEPKTSLDSDLLDIPTTLDLCEEDCDAVFPRSVKNTFLSGDSAVEFYRNECRKHQLLVNNSFVKFLKSGSVIVEFNNGYLGENGIVPIMETLQQMSIQALLLPKCTLQDEQIQLICDTLCDHPTVESIDLSGNSISVNGAKSILRMLMKNNKITEVRIDPESPKSAAIARQAAQNGSAQLRTFSCLVCQHPNVYSIARQVEMELLRMLLSNFASGSKNVTSLQVEVIFRLISACCAVHNGVLSLCSEACVEKLSRLIYECPNVVAKACYIKTAYEIPNNSVIRQYLPTVINEFAGRASGIQGLPVVASDDDDNIENYFDAAIDKGLNEQCSVCDQKGKVHRNCASMLMTQLLKEVNRCEGVSSSGLLRLCQVMVSQIGATPCSRKCVRQLIRFGMYGFYGVIRSYPKQEPLVTSAGCSLDELPDVNFSLVDFSAAVVDRLDEEEITCALTVASAMEDIDNTPIDPYMIFAVGRHLRHQRPSSIGMELQSACEAVHLVGCLSQAEAPFHRRNGDHPPRRLYANWDEWHRLGDVPKFLFSAFARRRSAVYCVDGVHGNSFDNIRAALWAFRRQRRCVVITLKFSYSWLTEKSGVVPETSSAAGGFYTSAKVVGQTIVNNTLFLIIQGNFGSECGTKGFFYVPKSVFNRHICNNAYIFVDICQSVGAPEPKDMHAAEFLSPAALDVVEATKEHGNIFEQLINEVYINASSPDGSLVSAPPAIRFVTNKACSPSPTLVRSIRYGYMLTAFTPMLGQVAHYISEICSPGVAGWIQKMSHHLHYWKLTTRLLNYSKESAERSKPTIGNGAWSDFVPESLLTDFTSQMNQNMKRKKSKRGTTVGRGSSKAAVPKDEAQQEDNKFFGPIWAAEASRLESLSRVSTFSQNVKDSLYPHACSPKLNKMLLDQQRTAAERTFQDNSFTSEYVGRRWSLMHVCDEEGKLAPLVSVHIHNKACLYDLHAQQSILPLVNNEDSELFDDFPFTSGFDCCFHHPLKPRSCYVFSKSLWLEWDTAGQKCLRGPCSIGTHPQFEKLPSQFHHHIDCTLPVPNTPYVFFLTQKMYVLFNLNTSSPHGSVQLLASESNTLPAGSPIFPVELTGSSSEPMTCCWNKDNSLTIICNDGVMIHTSFSGPGKKGDITTSELLNLPMVFKQMTSEAVRHLCRVVEQDFQSPFNAKMTQLQRFDEQHHACASQTVKVTSHHMHKGDARSASLFSSVDNGKHYLLSDCVVYRGAASEGGDKIQDAMLEFNLSNDFLSFCGVMLILDVSKFSEAALHMSQPRIAVESSMDRVTYRFHTTFHALSFIPNVSWSNAHVARYWRLRFIGGLAEDMGVVRVFWYQGTYASQISNLPVLESYVPLPGTASISVLAKQLYRPADHLWRASGGSVFTSGVSKGWYEKHAVLPLLTSGRVLFFCGGAFSEFNMSTFESEDEEYMMLQTHPAFHNLPPPFDMGFDSIFYPDEDEAHRVIMIRDGYELLWDLTTGSAVQPAVSCLSGSFEGVNLDISLAYSIVNVWGRSHEVDIIFALESGEAGILRWHLKKKTIIDPPKPLLQCPFLYHAAFHMKPLLTVFSLPRKPKAYYVFCEGMVANVESIEEPKEVRFSKQFFRLSWRLHSWCQKVTGSTVLVDFKNTIPMVLGVQFISVSASRIAWKIEYSDDEVMWHAIGSHIQDKPQAKTTWLPQNVESRSHRYWRFTTADSKEDDIEAIAYKLLSFLVLPLFRFSELPKLRVASSGVGSAIQLLRHEGKVTFSPDIAGSAFSECTAITSLSKRVNHITLDSVDFPLHLSGFSCECAQEGSEMWTVLCSDDGAAWHSVGSWAVFVKKCQFSWYTGRAYRFWRFETKCSTHAVDAQKFSVFGYRGPFVSISSKDTLTASSYSILMPLLYEANAKDRPLTESAGFKVAPGATVIIDTKATSASVVGVSLLHVHCSVDKVDFVVEYSNDYLWWFEAAQFSMFGAYSHSNATWNTVGSHRYWRLRVVSSTSEGILHMKNLFVSVHHINLYQVYLSQKDSRCDAPDQPECVFFSTLSPVCIVRVEVHLPPNSVYVVERLGLDGISWEPLAAVHNEDPADYAVVSKGWDSFVPSCSWRLRFVEFWKNGDSNAFPSIRFPLKWFTFTNRRLFKVNCEALSDLEVTVGRFETLDTLDGLHLDRTGIPVLSLAEVEPVEADATQSQEDNGSFGSPAPAVKPDTKSDKKKAAPKGKETKDSKDEPEAAPSKEKQSAAPVKTPATPDAWIRYDFKSPTRLSQVLLSSSLPLPVDARSISDATGNANFNDISEHASVSGVLEKTQSGEVLSMSGSTLFGPFLHVTVAVEVSDNGEDFVSVAQGVHVTGFTNLSWLTEEIARYWRIRFTNLFDYTGLQVYYVKWYTYQGVASPLTVSEAFLTPNTLYQSRLMETFNAEETFRSNCVLGLNQAKSQASKLREEGDIDRIGEIANTVWQRKKAFAAFYSKIAKKAARNAEVPEGPYFGPSGTLAKDINYMLHMATKAYPDSCFDHLIDLIRVPLVMKDPQFNKKDSHWFYPTFEVSSAATDDLFGFPFPPVSLSVLWSLSLSVQRDIGLLQSSDVSCISAHLASPIVTISIECSRWQPADHFPFIPFLYHGGFANRSMLIVFAINDVEFTDKYYLRTPVTGARYSQLPFRISSGVNFVRVGTVSQCPAPVFRLLNIIYSDAFLDACNVPLVLSATSMRCRVAKMRFTLPGGGVTFGIHGLEIGSIEFEITLAMMNQNLPPEGSAPLSPEMLFGECGYHIGFVTHNASFRVRSDEGITTIPIALSGSFDKNGSPVIQLTGASTAASIPLYGVRNTFITTLQLSGTASGGDALQSFVYPRLTVAGNMILPSGRIFPCRYDLLDNHFINEAGKLFVELWECHLNDLVMLSVWCRSAVMDRQLPAPKECAIMKGQCSIFASLEVELSRDMSIHGNGSVKCMSNYADNVSILVNVEGFGVACSISHARIGKVELGTSEDTGGSGVLMEATCMFVDSSVPTVSVFFSGMSDCFSPHAATKIHITQQGCVCVCSTDYFDVVVEESTPLLTCDRASVIVNNNILLNMVVDHLKGAPMVAALLAHGIPFCLSNEKVEAAPYSVSSRSLILRFCGVFFGSWFEVSTPSFDPTHPTLSYDSVCEQLALRTIEECQETMWASYASVVGTKPKDNEPTSKQSFCSQWRRK